MGFWNNLIGGKAPAETPVPAAPAAIQARPLEVVQHVGPLKAASGQAGVDHARYRLDAIHRTILQSRAALTDAHMEEFRTETRQHVHTLIVAGLMTDDEGMRLVKANNGMPK